MSKSIAVNYFLRGWTPIWIQRGKKKPIDDAWQKTVYTDEKAVEATFRTAGNIGIALGTPSNNLIDIDLDCSMAIKLAPSFLPGTPSSFGRASAQRSHWLYTIIGPMGKTQQVADRWTSLVGDKKPDKAMVVELRTNGQTVFPGSVHESGEAIEWVEDGQPTEIPYDELLRHFGRLAAATLLARCWSKLTRHEVTLPLAGTLLRGGYREDEAVEFIRIVASSGGDTEVSDRIRATKDTAEKIRNGVAVSGIPTLRKCLPPQLAEAIVELLYLDRSKIEDYDDMPHLTDVGNAERFMKAYGTKFHYSGQTGWLYYDGTRWTRDRDCSAVGRAAQSTVKAIWQEGVTTVDKDQRDKILKWAKLAEGVQRVKAIPELVKSAEGIVINPDSLDTQDLWINVQNGTLDLTTGELRPHDQADLITRMAPFAYDPDAQCPKFLDFLHTSMGGDMDMMDFLLRCLSLGLAGTPARNLFIWWGVTNSGKSTLLSIIEQLLGDYAASAQSESLMADKGGVRSDLARLSGTRFVRISEAEDGRKMAEAMVKQITGNDAMTAAFKFKDDFQFRPKFKVTMATNYKPVVRADDEALWERVILIPWEHTVPSDQRVPDLDRRLLEQEGSGILAVLVEAFREVMKNGLRPPDKVKAATTEYRDEMDSFGDWLEEETEEDEDAREPLAKAFMQYARWCKDANLHPVSRPGFTRRLTSSNIEHKPAKINGRTARCLFGRRLLAPNHFN